MGSGGCGVLARKGTGISNKFNHLIPECVSHRICIAWVAAISNGGVYLVSIDLKDSVGMNAENKMVSEHAAAAIRCLDGPDRSLVCCSIARNARAVVRFPR